MRIIFCILILTLGACNTVKKAVPGEVVDFLGIEEKRKYQEPVVTPEATPAPTLVKNPGCAGNTNFRDGNEGNLWKPKSDHHPECVMLVHRKFIKEFECKAELSNGQKDKLRFSGFSNGMRQTFRCNKTANQYKWNAKIDCSDGEQTCTFQIPGSPKDRHD